jgi:hypothetical protein
VNRPPEVRKQWYSPNEINFTRWQLTTFVIPNIDLIRQGEWPPEPSGYVDLAPGRTNNQRCARFVPAIDIAAEYDIRIEQLPFPWLLDKVYADGWLHQRVARYYHISYKDVRVLENLYLGYVKGSERKRMTYEEWLKSYKNHENERSTKSLDKLSEGEK